MRPARTDAPPPASRPPDSPPEPAGRGPAPDPALRPGLRAALAAAVFTLTALVFWPAGGFEFLNYDDVVYVTANSEVRGGLTPEGARWALTATDTAANWHPLTWLAHMLDVELFGLDPRGHHLSSVVWHGLAAALVFLTLASLLRAPVPALAAALLFALHPLRVEAVAMVADRKDLIAGCAGAATLWAWLTWRRRGGAWRFALALACYAAGLAAKPTLLSWFAVLWLADRSPFVPEPKTPGEARRRRLALACLAALALAALCLTVRAQSGGGAFSTSGGIPLGTRLANASAALAAYGADTVWPRGLAFFYPHPALVPGEGVPATALLAGLALAAFGTSLARRSRVPAVWLGWGWFLLTLLPALGLVQVGLQARADRYTYLPSIGLSLALAGALAALVRRRPAARWPVTAAVFLALGGLVAATRTQLPTWRDTRALMTRALEVTEHNFLAHTNLAGVLESEGRLDEALVHLNAALEIRPGVPAVQLRAGDLERRFGRPRAAAERYAAVVELEPDHAVARLNLGALLAAQGDEAGAVEQLARAFEVPGLSDRERLATGQALSWLLATTPADELRDGDRAAAVAEACLRIERSPLVLDALAAARAEQGRFDAATLLLQEALRSADLPTRLALEQRLARYAEGKPWRRP